MSFAISGPDCAKNVRWPLCFSFSQTANLVKVTNVVTGEEKICELAIEVLQHQPSSLSIKQVVRKILASKDVPICDEGKIRFLREGEIIFVPLTPCLSLIERALSLLRAQIFIASDPSLPNLVCPITLELFESPMTGKCGHTFEERAIRVHLSKKDHCPTCRQPMKSEDLHTVFVIRGAVETLRQKPPIPLLSLFEGSPVEENFQASESLLAVAREERDLEKALSLYKIAFQYTNSLESYAEMISRLWEAERFREAALAHLFLVRQRLQRQLFKEAAKDLQKALEAHPLIEIREALAALYLQRKQYAMAIPLYLQVGEDLFEKDPLHSMRCYELVLHCDPKCLNPYQRLFSFYTKPKEQLALCLQGMCAMGLMNSVQCRQFFEKGKELDPQNPDLFHAYIAQLDPEKDREEIRRLQLALMHLYKEKGENLLTQKYLRKLVHGSRTSDHFEALLSEVQSQGREELFQDFYVRWIDLLFSEKAWGRVEEILGQAITVMGKTSFLLERLYRVHSKTGALHARQETALELAKIYIRQGESPKAVTYYREVFAIRPDFEIASALSKALEQCGGSCLRERVALFWRVSQVVPLGSPDIIECYQKIRKIDPLFSTLSSEEQQLFFMKETLCTMTSDFKIFMGAMQQRMDSLEKSLTTQVASLEGRVQRVEGATKTFSDFAGTMQKTIASLERKIDTLEAEKERCFTSLSPPKPRSLFIEKHTFRGHVTPVTCVALLSSSCFVSGSRDGKVKLWDIQTGKCLYTNTLKRTSLSVKYIKVLPEGRFLVVYNESSMAIHRSDGTRCQWLNREHDHWYHVTELSSGKLFFYNDMSIGRKVDIDPFIFDPVTQQKVALPRLKEVMEGFYRDFERSSWVERSSWDELFHVRKTGTIIRYKEKMERNHPTHWLEIWDIEKREQCSEHQIDFRPKKYFDLTNELIVSCTFSDANSAPSSFAMLVWNSLSGEKIMQFNTTFSFPTYGRRVFYDLIELPNGRFMVSLGDNVVRVFDIAEKGCIQTFKGAVSTFLKLKEGLIGLATTFKEGSVEIYDPKQEKIISSLPEYAVVAEDHFVWRNRHKCWCELENGSLIYTARDNALKFFQRNP